MCFYLGENMKVSSRVFKLIISCNQNSLRATILAECELFLIGHVNFSLTGPWGAG